MELLSFDTETRKATIKMTRAELLDLDAEFVATATKSGGIVSRTVRSDIGTLDIYVEEGWR